MRTLMLIAGCVAGVAAGASAADLSGSGLIVLNPSSSASLKMVGNSTVTIPARAVYVNSSHREAVSTTGSATLDAPYLYVVGGAAFNGSSRCTGQVIQSGLPYADPLASFPFPTGGDAPVQRTSSVKGSASLEPGYYVNGLSISSNADVTLAPGVYVFGGSGLSMKGRVIGEGVTLVILGGVMDLTAQADISLSPPTEGSTAGVVIAQPPSNTGQMKLSGGSSLFITGTIYAPKSTLLMVGNSSAEGSGPQMGDLVIADKVDMRGTSEIRIGRPGMRPIVLPKMPLFD